MSVLTDIRNRGVRDTFFLVCDGLKGVPEVVGNVWPRIEGLIRRAGPRHPTVDLLRLDQLDKRGLDRDRIAQPGTCSFVQRQQNLMFQGITGSGESYLGCALAKQAFQHWIRAHYIRTPDLEEAWALSKDKLLEAIFRGLQA